MKFYVKDLIYGANDGIVTTFAVVASVAGAGLPSRIILIIGIASLIADGFSMAASDYLGSKSQDVVMRGLSGTRHDLPPRTNPVTSGTFTFFAFVSAGSIPILPYAIIGDGTNLFFYTALLTVIALFLVGSLGTIITKRNFAAAGSEMVLIGGAAAFIAYLAGRLISMLIP